MAINPPPNRSKIPMVLVRTKEAYRVWHDDLDNLTRIDRHTLGVKIDELFCALLELVYRGCFAYDKFEKLSVVSQAIAKCDVLRFFLQISWEQKIIDNKQYGSLILLLEEVGRMLGGWKRSIEEKTPARK